MRLAYKCPVMVESTKGMEEFVAEVRRISFTLPSPLHPQPRHS